MKNPVTGKRHYHRGAGNALEHPRRRLLADLIARDPGLTFRGLVKASGIPCGTCRHHLTILLRHGFIWEQRWECRVLHYAGQRPVSAAERLAAVHDSLEHSLQSILGTVQDHGELNQTRIIALHPDAPRGTIQGRVKRLVRYGFLAERASGRQLLYTAATP